MNLNVKTNLLAALSLPLLGLGCMDLGPGSEEDSTSLPSRGSFPNISSIAWDSCDLPDAAFSVPECQAGATDCLEKVAIDTAVYPDAICNDGSPGVMFIRPAPSGIAEDKWIVHLEGGGAVAEGGEAVGRWCKDKNYDASKMSSAWAPDSIGAKGIFEDRADNQFADWNQVFLYYCSSDNWLGRTSKTVLGYAGEYSPLLPANFSIEFRGYEILIAAMRTLQSGGLVVDGDALPSLDDASHVLFSGSSAGGAGARHLADRLDAQLSISNPSVDLRLVVDAAVKPIEAWLNGSVFPGGVVPADNLFADMDDYRAQNHARMLVWDAPADNSCLAAHAADPEACSNTDHLLFNHITTPFFVRQDLADRIPDGADAQVWAEEAHAHLLELADIQLTAEEGADITVVPGVFAPSYGNHVGLDVSRFYDETVSGLSFHDVLWNWGRGLPDSFILEVP